MTERMHHKTGDCSIWRKLTLENKRKLVHCLKHPFSSDGHKMEECEKNVSVRMSVKERERGLRVLPASLCHCMSVTTPVP